MRRLYLSNHGSLTSSCEFSGPDRYLFMSFFILLMSLVFPHVFYLIFHLVFLSHLSFHSPTPAQPLHSLEASVTCFASKLGRFDSCEAKRRRHHTPPTTKHRIENQKPPRTEGSNGKRDLDRNSFLQDPPCYLFDAL